MANQSPIPVVLNPKARSELSGGLPARISKLSPRVKICPTEYAGHASEIAYNLVKEGHKMVVAAGGDGTVNEVANGLARANIEMDRDFEEDAALGVLPTGTMNVFAVELGFSPFDIGNCWRVIESGATRTVDLWKANDHLFVQLAGVGFDAEVIRGTSWERKKKYGPLGYAITALSLIKGKHPELEVTVPGREPIKGATVLIGNGKRYGGPSKLFSDAINDDGLLDVIVMDGMGFGNLLRLLRAFAFQGFESVEGVTYFQASEFSVTGTEPIGLEIDGELVGETPVEFRPAERKLKALAL